MKPFRLYKRQFRKRTLVISALLLFGLSFLTSWYFNSTLSVGYQQKKLQRYINEQENDAQQVLNDTALMRRLVYRQESKEEFEWLASKKWGLFLFAETLTDQDLLFWNSQKIVHPPVKFDSSYGTDLEKLQNGYYVTQKKRVVLPGMSNNKVSYVMIPVLNQLYLETAKTPTSFAHDEFANDKIEISEEPTAFPVKSIDGKLIFYVKRAAKAALPTATDAVTLVFRLTALLLLLLAIHLYAELVVRRRGAVAGIAFLAAGLILCRLLLSLLPALVPLRQVPLFDPTIYASDGLNNSLGALLINAMLLCWVVLFAWSHLGPVKLLPRFLQGKRLVTAGTVAVALLLFITFQLAEVVNRLVVDSKISFEVTDYSKLNIYTAISFFILALLSLSYYYFSRLLFRFILLAFPNLLYLYFTVAVIGLLFLSYRTFVSNYNHKEVLFYLPVLVWFVMFTLLLTQEQSIINRFRITIAGLLFWVFIFSVSLASLIMQGNRLRETSELKKVAQKVDTQSDPQKYHALSIQMAYLNDYFLRANFHRFANSEENTLLRDSITSSTMGEYNAAYSASIYVFDSVGRPVNNPDNLSYDELNNVFLTHRRRNQNRTTQKEVAYYETSPTRFAYIVKKEASDSSTRLGTFFLISTPRSFQGREKFYPDLFSTAEDAFSDLSLLTAIYDNNRLVYYHGNYQFHDQLSPGVLPTGESEMRENGDYNELMYRPGNRKLIIVAQKKDTFIESITLFSYLFCAFLLMVGSIRAAGLAVRLARTWPRVDLFSRMSIRSQIHATIIFISVLSFLIIGVATITYFVERNKRENIEALYRTAANTLDELQKQAKEDDLAIDSNIFNDSISVVKLKRLMADISDVHGQIVNIYDTSGVLKITSDDNNIYSRGVLSLKMDPVAFYNMQKIGEVQRVQNEYISNFEYLSIYRAIADSTKQKFAYLNIPYFGSQNKLNQEISNFLVTIINLNAFIVLIAGVIALFITNRISRSFSVIGDKMKAITLGQINEEIEWNKTDEIGELVNQYNKMVQQLEESASALAKSEREGAWREMARQVAHEIKNPLTPMKLSIQYLQKAIQNNQPNVKELTTSVATTLIEQIEHLSKIAGDFSQFANIGNKRPENIDLHNVIGSLLDLYTTNPKVSLQWEPVPQEAIMQADKTHMNRLFTNLLTNAVDACSEREECRVMISEKIIENNLLIAISDNGDGIAQEMQSKIFTPNFTTKTSGTGLGLAMCKGIVEQAGGDIWFETKLGVGTTFFVQLPLAVDDL